MMLEKRIKIAQNWALEMKTETYNRKNNTNITTDDMQLIIEEEEQKRENELYKKRQVILDKLSKNEALTPDEYEMKRNWDYEIDSRNKERDNFNLKLFN